METSRKYWSELKVGLLALVQDLSESIEGKNVEIVRDFIENREYGVALEWLRSSAKEHDVQLSNKQEEEFRRLASLMNIKLA